MQLPDYPGSLFVLSGDFVFEMEGRKRPIRGKVVVRDHFAGLRKALGGLRMGAEVSLQPRYRDFAQFVSGCVGMDNIFPVKLGPSFKQLHRGLRRIASCYRQTKTLPIRLKLFILAVTVLQ